MSGLTCIGFCWILAVERRRWKMLLRFWLLRGQVRAFVQFRRAVQAEMVLGALILLITATFTTVTGPPR